MEQLRPGSMPQCASRRIVDHRLEMRRLSPFVQSGFLGSFPFDPVGLDSPANAEKEIKNGRLGAPRCRTFRMESTTGPMRCCRADAAKLGNHAEPPLTPVIHSPLPAMLAFVGFASVYANRGQTPLQALKAHIADPGQQNSAPSPLCSAAPRNDPD